MTQLPLSNVLQCLIRRCNAGCRVVYGDLVLGHPDDLVTFRDALADAPIGHRVVVFDRGAFLEVYTRTGSAGSGEGLWAC